MKLSVVGPPAIAEPTSLLNRLTSKIKINGFTYQFPNRKTCIRCAVRFRPCIDIHKGKVKQIFGSTLSDAIEGGSSLALVTNFESDKSAAEYAKLYKEDELMGGHVIMLGADPLSQAAAIKALHAYLESESVDHITQFAHTCIFIEQKIKWHEMTSALSNSCILLESFKSSTVSILSLLNKLGYIMFNSGQMDLDRLKDLVNAVGKKRLVLDLSCRKKEGRYAVVADRWQKFSDLYVDERTLEFLAVYADEFLVHGVDVEGKKLGIDEELVSLLGKYSPIPMTYAGGVTVMEDLERIKVAGNELVDVTVGSALDIFDGSLAYKDVVAWHFKQEIPAASTSS